MLPAPARLLLVVWVEARNTRYHAGVGVGIIMVGDDVIIRNGKPDRALMVLRGWTRGWAIAT